MADRVCGVVCWSQCADCDLSFTSPHWGDVGAQPKSDASDFGHKHFHPKSGRPDFGCAPGEEVPGAERHLPPHPNPLPQREGVRGEGVRAEANGEHVRIHRGLLAMKALAEQIVDIDGVE
ncbi:MAG TPA: hypothetical protein VI653_05505, partial [Steroidobacteraceae bacterium]